VSADAPGNGEFDRIRAAAHRLRTDVAIARGHAELIQSSGDRRIAADALVVLEELGRIFRIAERLFVLVASALPGFLQPRPLDLRSVLDDAVGRWRTSSVRRWRVEVSAQGTLVADGERLAAALDALLENALSFTSDGDEIAIVALGEGETAVIEISDTGAGIPSTEQDRIFDPFVSSRRPGSRVMRGTGLGLAVVDTVADAHGGSITVESRPGHGATFRLRLPGFLPDVQAAWPHEPAGSHERVPAQVAPEHSRSRAARGALGPATTCRRSSPSSS
jgi:two-component system, OmpR family, sensor kinase